MKTITDTALVGTPEELERLYQEAVNRQQLIPRHSDYDETVADDASGDLEAKAFHWDVI